MALVTSGHRGKRKDEKGWIHIVIWGDARERGIAYGQLCAEEFKTIQRMLRFFILETYGQEWTDLVRQLGTSLLPRCEASRRCTEWITEMKGITQGFQQMQVETTFEEVFAWNYYCSLPYWLNHQGSDGSDSNPNGKGQGKGQRKTMKEGGGTKYTTTRKHSIPDRCSAFIAVGKTWTVDGDIVCAHNSFSDYIDGQFSNVMLEIHPTQGNRMMFQTSPGWIWSGTDFFVTSAGILGTETTFGGFDAFDPKGLPVLFRIRHGMQYGNSLDEICTFLLQENAGDYANAWLLGHAKSKEILRCELGLAYHSIERTQDGYFIGFNAPYDPRIRNLESSNTGFYDIRRHQGARKVRLGQLMEKWKGRLNAPLAKQIIADHFDVYTQKANHPCSRTVCSHYDLDAREYMSQESRPVPFAPRGAVDGMVCTGAMAQKGELWARFGSSCGRAFHADTFCRQHPQFASLCPFLQDRPSQPWVHFISASSSSPSSPSSSSSPSLVSVKQPSTKRRQKKRGEKRKRKPLLSGLKVQRNKKTRKNK